MFLKVSTSGGHRYVRLVESFRNEDGQPRQRMVATPGRLDEHGGPLDALLSGLLRAKGRPVGVGGDAPQVRFESALALGDVWVLDALWHELDEAKSWRDRVFEAHALLDDIGDATPTFAAQVRRALAEDSRRVHAHLAGLRDIDFAGTPGDTGHEQWQAWSNCRH